MVVYAIATSLVMLSASGLAALWPGLRGNLDHVIGWFILVPALLTLVALALGLAGHLTPTALIATHSIIAGAVLILLWRRRMRHQPVPGSSAGGRLHHRWRPFAAPWFWVLVIAWAFALSWMVYTGLLVPPFGWDGLSYHIPPAVWWLQAGRVYPVPTQFTFGYGYPQGMSLLILWQLAFTQTDHWVNVVQVPFVMLGALAAYGLAREVGIGRPWAWWAAAFFGVTPIVLEQAVVPYNDVAVAALTLAAFYLVLRVRRVSGSGPLWLSGVALGLILGIKPNGVLVAGMAGLLAFLPLRRMGEANRSIWRVGGQLILAFGVPAVVVAGYWYVRDLVLYGNPLYPAAIRIFGYTLFPGPRTVQNLVDVTPGQSPWHSFTLALHEFSHWYSYDTPNGGFGPVFTVIGMAAMGAAGLHGLLRRRVRMVAVLGAGLLLLCLQPFKYPRYVLFLPALAGISFAYVLQRMAGRPGRRILQAGAAALMLFALVFVPYQPQLSSETFQQIATARAEGNPPSTATFGLARDYAFMDTVPELEHPDNRIAYTAGPFVYPLMGRNREIPVYYVPTGTYESWLQKLQEMQTTFLIVANDRAIEDRWANEHPEQFVRWLRAWPFTVYLLRSDEPRNQILLNARGGIAR